MSTWQVLSCCVILLQISVALLCGLLMHSSSWLALVLLCPSLPFSPIGVQTAMMSKGMHCIYGCLHVQGRQAALIASSKEYNSRHVTMLLNSWSVIQKAGNMSIGPLADCTSAVTFDPRM